MSACHQRYHQPSCKHPNDHQRPTITFQKADLIRVRCVCRFGCFLWRRRLLMRIDRWLLRDWWVHKSVQLKLFAKTLVEHAGGNETAHSAQSNAPAYGVT